MADLSLTVEWRASLLISGKRSEDDHSIFSDTAQIVRSATVKSHTLNQKKTAIAQTLFEITLKQLVRQVLSPPINSYS